MSETLTSYGTGLALIVLLSIVWVGVQNRWRKAFPEVSSDPDVLAGRMGCHGCKGDSAHCRESAGSRQRVECRKGPSGLRSTNEEIS